MAVATQPLSRWGPSGPLEASVNTRDPEAGDPFPFYFSVSP